MGQVRAINPLQEGMDLRDYFAAKALQGFLASSDSHQERFGVTGSVDNLVRSAYTYADAMMKAREKK
jgi:hypothetical protein